MNKPGQHLIGEVPRRPRLRSRSGSAIGDGWSNYCTLNHDGGVVDSGRFRSPWDYREVVHRRVSSAGCDGDWNAFDLDRRPQLQELGHEVIVANVRELRAILHTDRKNDQIDAEKLARYVRLDPSILRSIARPHRRTATAPHPDPCASSAGATAHGSGECRSWPEEVLRLP